MTFAGRMNDEEILRVEREELKRAHREMDGRLRELEAEPRPDSLSVLRLKKQKLVLKDRIARIEDRLFPDIIA